jgi:hypothetical protein
MKGLEQREEEFFARVGALVRNRPASLIGGQTRQEVQDGRAPSGGEPRRLGEGRNGDDPRKVGGHEQGEGGAVVPKAIRETPGGIGGRAWLDC